MASPWHILPMRPLFAFSLLLASCAGPHLFKHQAAFELECPAYYLEVWQVAKRSWAVRGCGKRAVYHHINGVWMRTDPPASQRASP